MITPVMGSVVLFKNFPVRTYCDLQQTRFFALVKMTTQLRWKVEKNRILNLPIEEKRKLYKFQDYVTTSRVDTWELYSLKNKHLEEKKHTLDDLAEYRKFSSQFKPELNKSLTERIAIYKGDITKLELFESYTCVSSLEQARILKFFGHVSRLNNNMIERLVIQGRVEETRPCGRSHMRWINQIKSAVSEPLHECTRISINRERWRQIIQVDAIVNAANSALRAGGGVDGAIHRAAGPLLQEECNTLGGCRTGDAKVTGGYNLPAKYVIHTVGPQDGSPKALESCYEKSLSYYHEYKFQTIAFPCISTGIYGFPNRLAAHIALRTARLFLENNEMLEKIIFCTFLPIDIDIYETLLQMYFPLHEWNYNDGATVTE